MVFLYNLLSQFFRYSLVGAVAFLVDYSVLYVLTEYLNIYYLLSATLSFIAGLIVNYLLSLKWVFHNSKLRSKTVEFGVYGLIGIVGLVLNNLIIYCLTEYLLVYYMISKLIAVGIVMVWNFAGRRFILFKD